MQHREEVDQKYLTYLAGRLNKKEKLNVTRISLSSKNKEKKTKQIKLTTHIINNINYPEMLVGYKVLWLMNVCEVVECVMVIRM